MDGFRKVAMDIVVVGWGLPRRMVARLPRLSLKGTYDRSSEGVPKVCKGLFLVQLWIRKLRELLTPVVDIVRVLVKEQFNTSTMHLSFPLVVSLISPGVSTVPYSYPHVDLYSYPTTAPHLTAVLYLTTQGGGGLHIQDRGTVSPSVGGLTLFTAGEENTHWVG